MNKRHAASSQRPCPTSAGNTKPLHVTARRCPPCIDCVSAEPSAGTTTSDAHHTKAESARADTKLDGLGEADSLHVTFEDMTAVEDAASTGGIPHATVPNTN